MVYVTGDTHGDQMRFSDGYWDAGLTADDTLIICGDFGFVFENDDSENRFLDDLEKSSYTICFVDGNHENYPAIASYPEEIWNGGRVHHIRQNIYHLLRGQVFFIDNKTIFTMGGAYSVDRHRRQLNKTYWKEELPNNDEYKEATMNLEKHHFCVDYILTHTAPDSIIIQMGFCPAQFGADAELTGFLEWVRHETSFRHWYFGHWHLDKRITEKFTALLLDLKLLG